ncbi:type II secretion system protein F (GspF) [Natranaerovirga hydrolytica]|uniref:Type II secretion system protein F (GspF) n=1 Tax=Natranaerovirga hydrolytica TaxID=680378 RepID=A0A4R1N3P4_9FIRM|nr:type II secretion system F family protein [Natranaerovirga hydrolytica]TCL00084.1 type II secretion system protein F (GspF) [Natranaerovirga hydrolytica]
MLGIIFSGIILLSIVILYVISKGYAQEELKTLDQKEYKLHQLMSLSLMLMDKVFKVKHLSKLDHKIKQQMVLLYGEKQSLYRLRMYMAEKIALVLLILFSFGFVGLIMGVREYNDTYLMNGNVLERPAYFEGTRTYNLEATMKKEGQVGHWMIDIPLEEPNLTTEQTIELLEYGSDYIYHHMLGQNESFDLIQYNLNLLERVPNTYITVRWQSDSPNLISRKGQVYFDEVIEGTPITLTAELDHKGIGLMRDFKVTVYPKETTNREVLQESLNLILHQLNQEENLSSRNAKLPTTYNDGDITIQWEEPKDNRVLKLLALGLLVALIIFFAKEEDLKKKVVQRNHEIRLDFPEFISKLTLLISAGMTVSKAWEKIVKDYGKEKTGNHTRYLYEQATMTWLEIQSGHSEFKAYENFGKRCSLPEFMKFTSILLQNMRKGTNTLIEALNEQSEEAWEKRKEVAKLLGEQASTKLLFPMMLMFVIVIIIIMVPALMSMGF